MSDHQLMPFGAYLSTLLSKYNLSAATVSRLLGHKSRTTLRRILTDQANSESMGKFLSEFLSAQILPLSAAEEQQLRQALEASRIGLANYLARMEMGHLLHRSSSLTSPRTIYLQDPQSDKRIPLQQFLDRLSCAQRVRMLIINSIPAPFFEDLEHFISGSPGCSIEIRHLLFLNDDLSRTVRSIGAALPVIGSPCYHAEVISPPRDQSALPILSSSIIVCQTFAADGTENEYQLGFSSSLLGHLLTFSTHCGVYKFWENMLTPIHPHMYSIKTALPSTQHFEDYLALTQAQCALEENCALYVLNPVCCLKFIPPELARAFLQPDTWPYPSEPPADEALREQFLRIHEQRFKNIYSKKRITHVLAPLQHLRAFARNGYLADPLFRSRPFTVAERRMLLTYFRDQNRDNPYFNIYFTKNDSASLRLNLTCSESSGIIFHSGTPSQVDTLINLEAFTTLFIQYFREILLPQHALSASASIAVLNSLIEGLPRDNA